MFSFTKHCLLLNFRRRHFSSFVDSPKKWQLFGRHLWIREVKKTVYRFYWCVWTIRIQRTTLNSFVHSNLFGSVGLRAHRYRDCENLWNFLCIHQFNIGLHNFTNLCAFELKLFNWAKVTQWNSKQHGVACRGTAACVRAHCIVEIANLNGNNCISDGI